MPYELQGTFLVVGVLAMLSMLVKHDRRIKRWFLRSRRRRRRRAYRLPVLR
jgi:hypothetical protein